MAGDSLTSATGLLDEATRAFIRRGLAGGLVELDDVKRVVVSLMADDISLSPLRVAEGLVNAGVLTRWQSSKLLAGKSKGFYLGSYRLLRPLGKGGMGVVYLGEHQIMKRLMALKILPSESLRDDRRIQRFKDEARASAQLDHANIVRAYDCAEAGGKLYIVMEYVEGVNLQQAVVRDGVMPVIASIDAIKQAALGLAHAHQRGIIHRDIKPSNLMLRSDGVLKVSDMGLARIGWTLESEVDGTRRLTGTADFVAPEQALNSRTVDARADIYSLGCTWYYLLTGRPPFSGQSVTQRLAKHQAAVVPDVQSLRPDCPPSVAELIRRMMAKRPDDRPASVSDLLVQLNQLRGIQPGGLGEQLIAIASSTDTSVDDSLMLQQTLSGGSLSSDGGLLPAGKSEELDFSDLPDIDYGSPAIRTRPPIPLPAAAAGAAGKSLRSTPVASHAAASASGPIGPAAGSGSQQVLLGIGLAFAGLALIAVVGMMIVMVMRPLPNQQPRLKSIETKDGRVIISQDVLP